MSKDNEKNEDLEIKSVDEIEEGTVETVESVDTESTDAESLEKADVKAEEKKDKKEDKNTDKKKKKVKLSLKERHEAFKKMKADAAEEYSQRTKLGSLKVLLVYFLIFAAVLTFDELVLRIVVSKGIHTRNLTFLVFIPAEAAFFTIFCGYGKKSVLSRILLPIVTLIITAYYVGQILMYFNSQSIFSLALFGIGGDAVGNFGWAVPDAIRRGIGYMLVVLIPLVIVIAISVIKKIKVAKGYPIWMHLCTILTVVILWFGGIGALRLGGNGRSSVYYLFFNTLADTDTTYDRLGALTTNVVELGTKAFGIGGNSADSIEEINKDDLILVAEEEEEKETKESVESVEEEVEVDPVVREPQIYENIDFNKLMETASTDDQKKMYEYFANREPSYTNAHTGQFEGYNLIYICAESFWTYACNEKVTPTLYKMKNNGIVLENYYNSFKNTTTNGEYAFNTSLWPDVSRVANCGTDVGSFAQSASKYMPQGLGDLTSNIGIETLGFHNYYGKYYRRILSWPNLGYTCKFMGSGMTFTTSWPASDLEMMQQSIPDYINSEEPFVAYYMTFSGHGPYCETNCIYRKNIANVKFILGDNSDIQEETALGYLACNYELDQAMEYLLTELKKAGKLENTVIVLTGDHYPYYLSTEGRDELAGYTMDEDFDIFKSTCIIYNAGMLEPEYVDTYCSNVDILPTVLNLFNIPFDSRLMAGTDIFDDRPEVVHKAALYNMSFINDMCKYNGSTGQAEWTEEAERKYTPARRDAYIEAMVSQLTNEYVASTQSIELNIFKHIWYNSGLMTADELAQEEQREANVISRDQQYNAEDEEEQLRKEQEKAAKQAAAEAEAAAAAAAAAQQQNPDQTTTNPGDGTGQPADVITE